MALARESIAMHHAMLEQQRSQSRRGALLGLMRLSAGLSRMMSCNLMH
jgi:hypothetical protein